MKSRTHAIHAVAGRQRPPEVTPITAERSSAGVSAGLAADLLRILGQQFYLDRDQLFFQERSMLIKAITLPAQWLSTRGMHREIPAGRYREIVMAVIQEVKGFGSMASARTPARYFWKVMQSHLQHHGEEYYDEAKAARNIIAEVALGLTKRKTVPATDTTIADLDALHRLAKSPGGPRRATQLAPKPEPQPQLDLFA